MTIPSQRPLLSRREWNDACEDVERDARKYRLLLALARGCSGPFVLAGNAEVCLVPPIRDHCNLQVRHLSLTSVVPLAPLLRHSIVFQTFCTNFVSTAHPSMPTAVPRQWAAPYFQLLIVPGSHEVTLQTHEEDIVFHDELSPAERCGVIRCTNIFNAVYRAHNLAPAS